MIQLASKLNLTDEQKDHFLKRLTFQGKKLLAIWIHFDRFDKEIERLKKDAPIYGDDAPQTAVVERYSQELFLEFDEFFVQYKSSLDYLARLPAALLGTRKWSIATFGKKGETVIRRMKDVLLAENKQQLANDFETHIFALHREEIKSAIEVRDRVNHFFDGGIAYENFRVWGIRKSGQVTFSTPMWNETQSILEFMNIAFHNHLKFCEDFIVFFLALYLPQGFGLLYQRVPADSPTSPWTLVSQAQGDAAVMQAANNLAGKNRHFPVAK